MAISMTGFGRGEYKNDNYHFMTRRFDREPDTGKKLHMQTLGALAHYDYNEQGIYSYEQAANAIYRLGMQQSDIEQLFRRMVFNVITRNQDDHVKNTSFLMDMRGNWTLSPAYDVTYAYEPSNIWLKRHQMSLNGKLEGFIINDLIESGKKMNISKIRCEKMIREVQDAVIRWPEFAVKAKLREEVSETIKKQHIRLE